MPVSKTAVPEFPPVRVDVDAEAVNDGVLNTDVRYVDVVEID